jgi:glyoxylase-like metal-dependent hydrolase (beta-lactamase superfamily II)
MMLVHALDHAWYHVREIAPGVYCIAEPSHVNSFLVLGSERAALVDTGLNIGDLEALVASITALPVIVVNTHYHHDHTGNNWRFTDIAIHEQGAEALARDADPVACAQFMSYVGDVIAAASAAAVVDDIYFHLFEGASMPRPLPHGFNPETYAVKGTKATVGLRDGDVIELGRRRLSVLHTPGHTPDSICLLDSQTHVLFGGDTINTGPVYAQGHDADVAAFQASCRRLAELIDDVALVGVAHFGRTVIDSRIILEHAAGFDAIIDGTVQWRIGRDYVGPCGEAVFDRFSIFVPLHSPYCAWALGPAP